jgi:hypothetical protein
VIGMWRGRKEIQKIRKHNAPRRWNTHERYQPVQGALVNGNAYGDKQDASRKPSISLSSDFVNGALSTRSIEAAANANRPLH